MAKLPDDVVREVYLKNRHVFDEKRKKKFIDDPDEMMRILKECRDNNEPLSPWFLDGIIDLLESRSEIRNKAFKAIRQSRKDTTEMYERDKQIAHAVKEAIAEGYGIHRADNKKSDSHKKIGAFDIAAKQFPVGPSDVERIYYEFYPSEKGKNK